MYNNYHKLENLVDREQIKIRNRYYKLILEWIIEIFNIYLNPVR